MSESDSALKKEVPAENGGGRAKNDSSCSEDDGGAADARVKPIISLPEVKVVTNEENEKVLLAVRTKLYRFDSNCDPPEWKERGIGELKILQNIENNSIRVVMRRDKIFKVCANHFITPMMNLIPVTGNKKAYLYTVFPDFSEEQPKCQCFAVKFGTVENADLFKSKFDEAKEILLKECDLYNGNAEKEDETNDNEDTDEENENDVDVARKISELNISKDEE